MKLNYLFVLIAILTAALLTSCAEPSTNENPRRVFNAESGNYEGPSPMPNAPSYSSR
jgi:hypothetical protein